MSLKSRNVREAGPAALRLCHLADVHLGYRRYNRLNDQGLNQREVDVALAFREAIDRVIKLKPDLVVIAGDLFHSLRPSNLVLLSSFREIRRLVAATRAPLVIVAGNHETPRRSDVGCVLRILSEIDGVHIADLKQEIFTFPSISAAVTCLPHQALLGVDNLKLRAKDGYRYNILVAHCQTQLPWISDFGGVDVEWSKLAPHEWDYIALGHVHSYRELALNAAYSGSLEYTSANIWAESQEKKGFLEISLPTGQRTFHALTSPRDILTLGVLEVKEEEPEEISRRIIERLSAVKGGIEGKIVRLEVHNIPRPYVRLLDHRELRKLRARALNLTIEFKYREQEGVQLSLTRAQSKSLFDELKEFTALLRGNNSPSAEVLISDKDHELEALLERYWHKSDPQLKELAGSDSHTRESIRSAG